MERTLTLAQSTFYFMFSPIPYVESSNVAAMEQQQKLKWKVADARMLMKRNNHEKEPCT